MMIIVTGGAGFIGSNILYALEQSQWGQHALVCCDRFGSSHKWPNHDVAKWRNIAKRRGVVMIYAEQLWDYIEQHQNKIEVIIHLGANSATTEKNIDDLITNNVQYTQRIIEWCATHSKRLIYASSASTYGYPVGDFKLPLREPHTLADTDAERPQNGYAFSKSMVDKFMLKRSLDSQLKMPPQWVGLRFFNVYGPHEYHKGFQASVIHHMHQQYRSKGHVELFASHRDDFKNGEQARDFVHVDDVAKVILWLLDHPQVNGIYNVGTGEATSYVRLAEAFFKAVGQAPKIEFVPTPEMIRSTYLYYQRADMARLRAAGYTAAMMSPEDGVKDYVQNYLMQVDGYR